MSNGRAHRLPRSIRRLCLLSTGLLLSSVAVAASPSAADPDDGGTNQRDKPSITEVKHRLDVLNHEAEIASEELNAVREQLKAANRRLSTLEADVRRQQQKVAALRSQVVGTAVSDYSQAGGLSTTTSFLVSDDASAFLDNLATKAIVERQRTGLLTRLVQQQRQLGIQEQQAAVEQKAIEQDKQRAAEHQASIDRKTAQAEDLLADLEAKERARLKRIQERESQATYEPPPAATTQTAPAPATPPTPDPNSTPTRSTPRVQLSAAPASGRAQAAVQAALAQLGDPYVYGAAGPDAFDCSGLTMYAWAAAGVSIPHASSMQPGAGTPVSISALMPGDLVFYYSPISHVAMYIGNGQVVHAPHTGSSVQIVPLNSMPVTSATRVG